MNKQTKSDWEDFRLANAIKASPYCKPTAMIFTLLYRGQKYYLSSQMLARLVLLLALNHNNQRKKGEK